MTNKLAEIRDFIYFVGTFLILYWIFVLLFDRVLFLNKAYIQELEMDYGILRSTMWTRNYYLASLISFIIASALSGIVQASYRRKRSLWANALIFIVVFFFIDTLALLSQCSFWDSYPIREHVFTAPVLAIIFTILIIRKIGRSKKRDVICQMV